MPRLSANLGFLWPDRPLLDRIDAAARAGFRACEFHWPYAVPAEELAVRCRQHGMKILGINTPAGDVVNGERGLAALIGREQEFQQVFDGTLSYALAACASAIHVMVGNVAAADRSVARQVLAANLMKASAKSAGHNITLLLEPLNPRDNPGYFYSTLAEAASLIRDLNLPNLKLQFDVYHVAITEGDVLTKLAAYLPIIGNVQIAAVPSRAEPDEGEIAYAAVFQELDRLGYTGYVGCEYKPRGDTDAGLAWMEKFGIALHDTPPP